MSVAEVERYLFDLKNEGGLQSALRAGDLGRFAAYDLTPAERHALSEGDFEWLWRAGVHPLLIVPFSRFMGVTAPTYTARMSKLQGSRVMSTGKAKSRLGGGVVFAAAMSHAPHILAFPDAADASQRDAIYAAMDDIGRRLRASQPDVLVVVAPDHFTNMSPAGSEQFLVGSNDMFYGPVEDWTRVDKREAREATLDANSIFEALARVAPEVALEQLRLEHGVTTPLAWLDPENELPLVPVIQNCLTPPLPTLGQCYAVGQAIARVAIRTGRRFAVVGTGGLSHSPGSPDAGRIDERFDRDFLDLLSRADVARILDLPDERVDSAGFGTWEIRQWITALGASSGSTAEVLAYEPVVGWETGCGVVEFTLHRGSGPGNA